MSKKVMIIEDDADLLATLSMLFKSEGYSVEPAPDGQVALALLRAASSLPQVILLDLMMPRMDGFQFRLRQKEDARLSSIPVVAMTADNHPEITKRVQADAFVQKPFDLEILLEVVARYTSKAP